MWSWAETLEPPHWQHLKRRQWATVKKTGKKESEERLLPQTSKEEMKGAGKQCELITVREFAQSMRESKSSSRIKEGKIIKTTRGSE